MKDIKIIQDGKKTAEVSSFMARHQKEGLVVFRPTELSVMITGSDFGNKEFMESEGIKSYRMGTGGGCIVAFPDNLEIGLFTMNLESMFLERVTDRVMEFFRGKGLNVILDNNDVLVDGKYKVFSTSKMTYNGTLLLIAIHVSINCDAELVDKICSKPMKKIPKGLSEYGITSDEMLDLIIGIYKAETPNI